MVNLFACASIPSGYLLLLPCYLAHLVSILYQKRLSYFHTSSKIYLIIYRFNDLTGYSFSFNIVSTYVKYYLLRIYVSNSRVNVVLHVIDFCSGEWSYFNNASMFNFFLLEDSLLIFLPCYPPL